MSSSFPSPSIPPSLSPSFSHLFSLILSRAISQVCFCHLDARAHKFSRTRQVASGTILYREIFSCTCYCYNFFSFFHPIVRGSARKCFVEARFASVSGTATTPVTGNTIFPQAVNLRETRSLSQDQALVRSNLLCCSRSRRKKKFNKSARAPFFHG